MKNSSFTYLMLIAGLMLAAPNFARAETTFTDAGIVAGTSGAAACVVAGGLTYGILPNGDPRRISQAVINCEVAGAIVGGIAGGVALVDAAMAAEAPKQADLEQRENSSTEE